ncbi:ultraviolet-B receptor UVR8 isoform X2 [Juglans microcarpa x Juglans regia]|uniref:ultraviolet-B receptor UVR8 isoform X2 n=1 Tax=Juglans microcarpa x Juglans regia TaxID=2249226 RepID=UPI001B7F4E87|nr:ultraviolet-B receptor UVR8 isoform X2 [Juglans microcarpa x Juglans regia]
MTLQRFEPSWQISEKVMWSRSCGWRIIRRFDTITAIGIGIFGRWISSEASGTRFAAVWGNGDYGRLGLGSLESQWRPAICSAFRGQNLRAISCGGAHTLFLTESGRVFATGLNDFGQLGISQNKSYATEPVEVSGLQKDIVQISAGYHHSCAVTVDGELYMWGKNSNGQLGLGKRAAATVHLPTKVECLDGITIKMAALGSEHSVAITDGGEALSWGLGGSGRLGHGHESSVFGFFKSNSEYTPRLIKNLEGIKVKNVAAGLLHSACIDENGCVFIFGEKVAYKVGVGDGDNATARVKISKLPYSEEVSCGGYHTCVLTSSGQLYTWGSNENGCLGIGSTDVFHIPERVQGPFLKSPVTKVSCGWKHTAAISGNIFTWGWGGSHGTFSEDGHSSGGQLGHGSDVDRIEPAMVTIGKNVKALQISCGFNHTGAILEYT